jgi:hypothetical protein
MNEPPPILGRWGRLYALVILDLALCIVLFRIFAGRFS